MPDRHQRYDAKLIRILQNACGIFAEKGYHDASVRDVAAATGVSPAGLYYYFRSKEELLFLILHHALSSLLSGVGDGIRGVREPKERIRILIRVHLAFHAENEAEMRVLAQEWRTLTGEFASRIRSLQDAYVEVVSSALRELAPRATEPELEASAMGLLGMLSWIHQWYTPLGSLTVDGLADVFSRIFLDGFRPREGGRFPPEGWLAGGRLSPTHAGLGGPAPSVLSGPSF